MALRSLFIFNSRLELIDISLLNGRLYVKAVDILLSIETLFKDFKTIDIIFKSPVSTTVKLVDRIMEHESQLFKVEVVYINGRRINYYGVSNSSPLKKIEQLEDYSPDFTKSTSFEREFIASSTLTSDVLNLVLESARDILTTDFNRFDKLIATRLKYSQLGTIKNESVSIKLRNNSFTDFVCFDSFVMGNHLLTVYSYLDSEHKN